MSETMNTKTIFAACAALLLISCKEEKEKPKVIYESTPHAKDAAVAPDTTQIEVADLPVMITGTDYLIHPIGDLRINDRARASATGSDVSYSISNYGEFEITGFLRNLKFQQKDSDSLCVLSDKPVMIQTASFLKPVSDKLKKQLMVYTLSDMDTNKDGKIDSNDIRSLYISHIDGSHFVKLSTDFEELIDWKLVENVNRLYFRTIEDTNKNGEFDKNDIVHYHMVDLSAKEFKPVDYKPV